MRRRDEVLVGLFTSVAVIVGVLGSIWFVRGGLAPGYPLHSRFVWGSGIKQGAPVWLVGVTVGVVDRVELDPTGILHVTYRIQSQYKVPRGTTAAIVPSGFFGDQAVALTPLAPNPDAFAAGDTVPVTAGPTGLQALTQRADSITMTLSKLLTSVQLQLVDSGGLAGIRQTTRSVDRLVNNFSRIADLQSQQLQLTMETLRGRINAIDPARVDSTLRSLQSAASDFAALTKDLTTTSTRLNALLAKAESGDGTLAKVLNDPGLYNDIRRLAGRMDSLLIDFQNNPRKYIKFSIW